MEIPLKNQVNLPFLHVFFFFFPDLLLIFLLAAFNHFVLPHLATLKANRSYYFWCSHFLAFQVKILAFLGCKGKPPDRIEHRHA